MAKIFLLWRESGPVVENLRAGRRYAGENRRNNKLSIMGFRILGEREKKSLKNVLNSWIVPSV